MSDRINTLYVAETARAAAEEVSVEMQKVHGPLWDARDSLAKLVVSLSSAILVGTITFSGDLIGSGSLTTNCPILVVTSWFLLFLALVSSVMSLWFSANLKSFRVRLTNAEPALKDRAGKIDPSLPTDQLQQKLVELVSEYANAGSVPLGRADVGARWSLNISLISFSFGVGVFLWFGALQVT
jgi:hypothetical protein